MGGGGHPVQQVGAVQGVVGGLRLVGGDQVHVVPDRVLGVIWETRGVEHKGVPRTQWVGGGGYRHVHVVARCRELGHHPAVSNGIVHDNGIPQPGAQAKVVVVVSLGLDYRPELVVDDEVGARGTVDHLDHVVGTRVQRGICRVHAGVAHPVDVDADAGLGCTLSRVFFLPHGILSHGQRTGVVKFIEDPVALGVVAQLFWLFTRVFDVRIGFPISQGHGGAFIFHGDYVGIEHNGALVLGQGRGCQQYQNGTQGCSKAMHRLHRKRWFG